MPNEVTKIHISWEEKKASELPLGTYEGKAFSINIGNLRHGRSAHLIIMAIRLI